MELAHDGSVRARGTAAFSELPIDAADAELAGELDWSHRDPFDRSWSPVASTATRPLSQPTPGWWRGTKLP